MQYSPSPLKKWISNWWRYQFCIRWWRTPSLKAFIQLEHGSWVIILMSVRTVIFCQRHHVLSDIQEKTAIRGSPCNPSLSHPPNFPWKATANSQIIQSNKRLFFSCKETPPSISPQLPLKHNQCLPTRLPSTSCLVTSGPFLSTTKRHTNSMSELNLETLLIYPPTSHWIDRRSLSRTAVCLIFSLLAAVLVSTFRSWQLS